MIEIMTGTETAFLTPDNARNNCLKHLSTYYRENMTGLKLCELYKVCQQKVMHCIKWGYRYYPCFRQSINRETLASKAI